MRLVLLLGHLAWDLWDPERDRQVWRCLMAVLVAWQCHSLGPCHRVSHSWPAT